MLSLFEAFVYGTFVVLISATIVVLHMGVTNVEDSLDSEEQRAFLRIDQLLKELNEEAKKYADTKLTAAKRDEMERKLDASIETYKEVVLEIMAEVDKTRKEKDRVRRGLD
ncbi:uncharacterized protein N0V89_009443 [Didymosphaeria variabile]|uniref:Uncharacterized protein n=1 Tax=Didymosphaeria variabile TaxID=1932322 RepID=A0A9W9C7A0_9PLEO|nr:uncharacterized protein N0V89_009443 [Didymosphaeria variabile]KAJ4348071.1 hypothetical protein N0V89_009443 [Didymosphaeria variabile]